MKPVLPLLVLTLLVSCAPAPQGGPEPAKEDTAATALEGVYAFGIAEAPNEGCSVTLKDSPVEMVMNMPFRPVEIGAGCEKYAGLRDIKQWLPRTAGSIALVGEGKRADFTPVQGGAGIYLRGSFEGDANLYELRPPQ